MYMRLVQSTRVSRLPARRRRGATNHLNCLRGKYYILHWRGAEKWRSNTRPFLLIFGLLLLLLLLLKVSAWHVRAAAENLAP
jgi:type II secretory pathway component PulL